LLPKLEDEMDLTGKLIVINGESTVKGKLLARCSESSPFAAATSFLQNAGFEDGDRVKVTGESGKLGSVEVLCITAVAKPAQKQAAATTAKGKRS